MGSPPKTAVAVAHHGPKLDSRSDVAKVALAAVGVVYGDIGTSPLYAIKECFALPHGVAPHRADVLGILSLVFWSLTLVIVVKYLTFVMRADNKGEGGTLALLALVVPNRSTVNAKFAVTAMVMLALFGTALLYGDGVITPAISVLSAVEGLELATPFFKPVVVPMTVAIIIALFVVQRRGTAGIGAVFGPTMLVWFVSIAVAAVPWIVRRPDILQALWPGYAMDFFVRNQVHGLLLLGSVVLCVTGGEALYADMGHFGRFPIRVAWFTVVFPALLCNYFGQGALLLDQCSPGSPAAVCRAAVANPFYGLIAQNHSIPAWVLYPMVVLAAIAAVVASQAMISGAFSLTQQAMQLGYCPRVTIVHTSDEAEGQIYIPEVNTALMVTCVALVLMFKESTNLAAAYGIAVTGTMTITSILMLSVMRMRFGWSRPKAIALVALFLTWDLAFFGTNVVKIASGGWFPIAIASVVFTLMTTWKRGRESLHRYILAATLPMDMFMADLKLEKPVRVKGTAVFMTQNPDGAPPALLHHFKHNKVLHEQVVLLGVKFDNSPEVDAADRVDVAKLEEGFWMVTAHYGFMQNPNVPEVMRAAATKGLKTVESDTSYYLGRETLLTSGRSQMSRWRKAVFAFMSRNARPATAYFGIPPNRVVELGTQIEL